jgi:hypothetical protein
MSTQPLVIGKYSLGMGDRFAHEAEAQLAACIAAKKLGVEIVPVWNKSNREHNIIGSEPTSTRAAADAAVKALGWTAPYFLDADHIGLKTVDRFVGVSDFFTIDVADFIAQPADPAAVKAFVDRHPELVGTITLAGIDRPFTTTRADVERTAAKFLLAVQEAGKVYRHIAPKFTGRFNKGVDYVGDLAQFEREFNDDLCVIAHAVKQYGLPANLKLSVHSGSDKFSIYPAIRRALAKHGAGVHVKTAGTTWLEEVIGLAEAGGAGLALAKEIYAEALSHMDELCQPYATVIDIDRSKLPAAAVVNGWTSDQFVGALRHDQKNPLYNANIRQLIHVGFKVAAKMGPRYLEQLKACRESCARNVTGNLFDRHIKPLFL